MNARWHLSHPMPKRATTKARIAWHQGHAKHCGCRPIPPKLQALMLREHLVGGDRRSVAGSKRALSMIEAEPALVKELARLANDPDALVSMRALDLLEKLAHSDPDWVQPHKRLFIGPLADSEAWEIHLQIVRALPLLRWTAREKKRVIEILERDLGHRQKFVRAWALDSLATFAADQPALLPAVVVNLTRFDNSGSKALATRARHIRERLDLVPKKRRPSARKP
ncbi:MAG: hypothetical protein U1E65_07340 [Myxococcota bacterium]